MSQMKAQHINLYHSSLQPVREVLTGSRVLLAVAVVVVLMLGWRGVLEIQHRAVLSEARALAAEQEQQRSDMTSLSQAIGQRRLDRALSTQVANLERDVTARRALLQEFQRRGEIRNVNYSPLLHELASIHRDGLWLTRISISAQGIELHGRTTSAVLIPQWMRGFENTQTLSPFQFSVVELRRDDQDLLNFALISRNQGSTATVATVPESDEEPEAEPEPSAGSTEGAER
ncbi:PilN domain-containing protein [Aliidiomarina celeris]|uniref:PilN domain-containing protein n=1 Tax=Aliidiomarina celeris TaxID=2249428 RepID=UPI000DEAF343|nr:PilN domain-containing protein [Aliidiomarina celeris]